MQSKGLSRVLSNTTVQKHPFFSAQLSSVQLSHPYMTIGKTITLTRRTFVGKVMSLLFNMLSRSNPKSKQSWVWYYLSLRRLPLIPPVSARTYTGLGNRVLEGTNRTLCTRTQEKGAVTPQETDPDLPGSVQESLAEVWNVGGLLQGWGH